MTPCKDALHSKTTTLSLPSIKPNTILPCSMEPTLQGFNLYSTISIIHARTSHPFHHQQQKMSYSSSVANMVWIVAASVGAIEALKREQGGLSRLSQAMRLVQQEAKTQLRCVSQANLQRLTSSYSALFSRKLRDQEPKQSEESIRKVMYLNSWGHN